MLSLSAALGRSSSASLRSVLLRRTPYLNRPPAVGRPIERSIPNIPRTTCFSTGGGSGGGNSGGKIGTGGSGGGGDAERKPGLWGTYLQLLETQPVLTRAATCAVLNGLGDVFSQLFVEKQDLDVKRTTTFTLMGLLFVGPVLYWWYSLLGKLVPVGGLNGVLVSLALDQLVFAPAFIASFMAVLTTIEGKPQDIRAKLEKDLVPAVKVNWILWVPAQYINFKFVPPNLRVLATNATALVWNVYMSYQSHKKVEVVGAGSH